MIIQDLLLSELTAELERQINALDAARMKALDRGESTAEWEAECYAANQLRVAVESCRKADRKLTPAQPKTGLPTLSELMSELERRAKFLDVGDSKADWVTRYAANHLRVAVESCRKADRKLTAAPPKTSG